MIITRLVVCTLFVFIAAGLALTADSPAVPRYKLEPGKEMTFRSTYSFKYGEKNNAGEHGSTDKWTVWVVKANQDGSFHLVIKEEDTSYQVFNDKKNERPTDTRIVYADIFPDGKIIPNDTIKYRGNPSSIFPKLPKDANETARGWTWEQDDTKYVAKPLKSDKGFRFEVVTESPMNVIYLSSSTSTSTFDPERACITNMESVSTQGYGFKGKGMGTTEMLGIKEMDPAFHKLLAAESSIFFESVQAYDKAFQTAQNEGPDGAKKQLESALEAFKAANEKIENPLLKTEVESKLKQHEQSAKYVIEAAGRREKVVGKLAEKFDTTDIDGKSVKLTELKGKVVVLDFWYRGCGWCIKAMPQLNGLVEDFAGKQVAILGMNTDQNEEDARFVIEKMGLKYPTLKAKGLPEKFSVQAFPTLIVIDQEGKVFDVHVGYSSTLREDVGRQIKSLLEKK